MRRIVLTFGLIAGAVMAAMLFLTLGFKDELDFDRGAVVGYASMVLAFLMVYFGVRTYRDTVAGGAVSFGRALRVGILITLVATVVYVAAWEFIYFRLHPDFADKYAEYVIEKERKSGATEEQLAAKRQEMAKFAAEYRNPLVNIGYTFLEPLPVGLLVTLVSAGVLSRRRPGGGAAA